MSAACRIGSLCLDVLDAALLSCLLIALVSPSDTHDLLHSGQSMATVFLRKVPKRQYPQYYEIIEQPIAMDDIKKKLDHGDYVSLEAVRSDFELMFNNAKQFNATDSYIYQDAKELMVSLVIEQGRILRRC